jgi:peptidyl-tRNA hydrolase, PTH2 family
MKQVILARIDLKLPVGKLAAQVAHASVSSYDKSNSAKKKKWLSEGMKKVVLKVKDEKELLKYADSARMAGLATSIITDAGRTVVEPGTITCVGIGPDDEDSIDNITGNLKML